MRTLRLDGMEIVDAADEEAEAAAEVVEVMTVAEGGGGDKCS